MNIKLFQMILTAMLVSAPATTGIAAGVIGGEVLAPDSKTVFSDCGCTVPEFSREPVKPGDEGEITVRFNGKGRPHGSFKKIVRVRSNALNSLAVAFVEGRIARPVRRK